MDIRVLDDNPLYRNEVYRLKFKFSQQYPIGMRPSCALALFQGGLADQLLRTSGGHVRENNRATDPNASPHILQRHYLPGPSRKSGLESRTKRRECLHEHTKHVDRK